MGKDSLQEFLGQWQVHPLHTFRHGFRRTWIVRAKNQPIDRLIYHEFGLAVIKEATPKSPQSRTERFTPPRPTRSVSFVQEKDANYPKSWAGVAAGAGSATASVPKKGGSDGAVSASVASSTAATLPPTRPRVAPSQIPVETPHPVVTVGAQQVNHSDLANMMAAAIESALKPMKERLEATIVPMQRTLESLQAEFIALRVEEKDNEMSSSAAADAKRMRTDADM